MMEIMVGHILVPGFPQFLHVEIFILVWHLLIFVPKSTGGIANTLVIHDDMESKWSTFIHKGLCGGPPVTTI